MNKPRRRARVGLGLAGLAAAASVLSGCASSHPGSAAIVGDETITESSIGDQMRAINELVGLPPDQPSLDGARTIVSFNVGYALVRQTADELKVSVPPATLDQVYNQQVQALGGEDQLFTAAAQRGISPLVLRRDLETKLLADSIAKKLAPGLAQQQQQQSFLAAVARVGSRIGVDVAPKYGEWDPEQLQIIPPTDPVSAPESKPADALPTP